MRKDLNPDIPRQTNHTEEVSCLSIPRAFHEFFTSKRTSNRGKRSDRNSKHFFEYNNSRHPIESLFRFEKFDFHMVGKLE